jgi:hypothetical protein
LADIVETPLAGIWLKVKLATVIFLLVMAVTKVPGAMPAPEILTKRWPTPTKSQAGIDDATTLMTFPVMLGVQKYLRDCQRWPQNRQTPRVPDAAGAIALAAVAAVVEVKRLQKCWINGELQVSANWVRVIRCNGAHKSAVEIEKRGPLRQEAWICRTIERGNAIDINAEGGVHVACNLRRDLTLAICLDAILLPGTIAAAPLGRGRCETRLIGHFAIRRKHALG